MLTELFITNFKSYKSVKIGPFKNFTAVIGPNGAGKSNLMDAISFVLGISSKALRGRKLADLIYKVAPVRTKAWVQIKLDVKVRQENGEIVIQEHCFRRTVNRASKDSVVCTYKHNGTSVGRAAYEQALESCGVMIHIRNFLVFQGDVESISQKTPRELSDWFERISGSDQYRQKYQELKKECEDAEQVLADKFLQKRSGNREKMRLKEQRDEALLYQQLLQKRDDLKEKYFLWQLYHMGEDLKAEKHSRRETQRRVNKENAQLSKLETEMKAISKEFGALKRKRLKINTKKYQSAVKKVEHQLAELNQMILQEEDIIKKKKVNLNRLKESQEKKQKDIQKLMDQKQLVVSQIDELKTQTENKGDFDSEYEEYKKIKTKAEEETIVIRNMIRSFETDKQTLKSTIIQQRTTIDELARQRGKKEQTISQINQNSVETVELEAKAREKVNQAKKELQAYHEKNKDSIELRKVINENIEKLRELVAAGQAHEVQSHADMRKSEAFDSLQRLFGKKRVYGRLFDLIRVTRKQYNLALTVALGGNMDAIVVEDGAVARNCIEHLRAQRLGIQTFLPLNGIKAKEFIMEPLGDEAKYLKAVIKYEPHFEKAINYSLGSTIVVSNINIARKIAFKNGRPRHKVVTLDGTVINKTGSMTGGASSSEALSRKANRWEQKDLQKAKKDLAAELHKLTELDVREGGQKSEDELKLHIEKLTHEHGRCQKKLIRLKDWKERETKEMKGLGDMIKSQTPKLNIAADQLQRKEKEGVKLSERLNVTEDKLFKDFCKKAKVNNIREWESSKLRGLEEIAERKNRLRQTVAKIENQIEYAKSKDLSKPISALNYTIKKKNSALHDYRNQKGELETRRIKTKEELLAKKKEEKSLEKESEHITIKRNELKDRIRRAHNIISTMEKTIDGHNRSIDRIRELVTELKETAHSQSISLPRSRKRNRREVINGKSKRRRRDGEYIEEEPFEAKQDPDDSLDEIGQFDFSQLHNVDIENEVDFQNKKKEYQRNIRQCDEQIENLVPNLKSIGVFDVVKEQIRLYNTEFDKAKGTLGKASNRFQEVKTARMEVFRRCFEHVKASISEIYKALTRSKSFPTGGKAFLCLDNSASDDFIGGIRFHAMPPMKRFRDMDQLSGGEKSVASLALCFAINSYKPSPFFVLDEVDAALDSANVSKVANYIKSRANRDGDNLQILVISLKEIFYEKADALVGIYKDVTTQASGAICVALNEYTA